MGALIAWYELVDQIVDVDVIRVQAVGRKLQEEGSDDCRFSVVDRSSQNAGDLGLGEKAVLVLVEDSECLQ